MQDPHIASVDANPRQLAAALEHAWCAHFHSMPQAVLEIRAWQTRTPDAGPAERAFALLIDAACAMRLTTLEAADESLDQARTLIARSHAHPAVSRLRALLRSLEGNIHWRKRELDAAMARYEEALADSAVLEPADIHYIRHWRSVTLLSVGRPELAFRDSLAALEYFRARDAGAFALLSFNVGAMLVHAGDWEAAEVSTRDALASCASVGIPGFPVMCRSNLAYVLINRGRVDEARREVDIVMAHDRDDMMRLKPGDILTTVAENLIETGYLDDAADYVRRALEDAEQRNFGLGIGTANWNAGRIAVLRGQPAEAERCWRTALLHLRHHTHMTQTWKTAQAASQLYAARGDFRRALRWHRRYHDTFQTWQASTRGIRLAYAQAQLELESMRAERDAAEAERARLADAMVQLEKLNQELQRRVHQVETLENELREQAMRDPLTGLLNRRGLLHTLQTMIEQSRLQTLPAVVAMLDLDGFKQVNDRYGHAVGDRLLAATGKLLLDFFRKSDVAFRFGGDEFCVLLPGVGRDVADARLAAFSLRLRKTLQAAEPDLPFDVTASVGLAAFPADGNTSQGLLDAADAALYSAKRTGGNTVH